MKYLIPVEIDVTALRTLSKYVPIPVFYIAFVWVFFYCTFVRLYWSVNVFFFLNKKYKFKEFKFGNGV